jgi:hypothetical protein
MAWAPPYATEDDLASYVGIDDTDDHVELALANESAARAIDQATNRQFGKLDAAAERIYSVRYDYERGVYVADVDDFQTTSGLVVTVDGDAVTTFTKEPVNAASMGRPWTRLVFTSESEVSVCGGSEVGATVAWGWTSVPDTIHNASLLQGARFFKRRLAPFGVAGSPDMGSELRLLAKVDPDVEVMVRAYRRIRAVG